jgi:5-methylcytosine-specific restriction endonuclease McrA
VGENAAAPETARQKDATYVEYRLSWALTNLKRDGLLENPRWSVWRLSGPVPQRAAELEQRISPERLAELGAMPYRDYLRTPEWRQTRAAALERADRRCSLDRTHSDQLEVHHNAYDRLGAELPSDLVVLCQACHRLHHKANGRPRRKPADSPADKAAPTGSAHPSTAGQSEAERPLPVGRPAGRRSLLRRILAGA